MPEAKEKFFRPVLDGNFEFILLEYNPKSLVRIWGRFFVHGQKRLVECLNANVGLFAVSLEEMSDIDPNVAYYQLKIDPSTRYRIQQRSRQSPKMAEEIMSMVWGLLDAKFIFEVRYIEWLSNVAMFN